MVSSAHLLSIASRGSASPFPQVGFFD